MIFYDDYDIYQFKYREKSPHALWLWPKCKQTVKNLKKYKSLAPCIHMVQINVSMIENKNNM